MKFDDIIISTPTTLTLTAGEIDLLRERIEAALRAYAPDTRRVYSSSLRIFSRWFSQWIYTAAPEIQRRLGNTVDRMHDQNDWWPLIQNMMQAGAIVSTTVASAFLAETCLQKKPDGRLNHNPSTATKAARIAGIRWPFALMRSLNVISWDLRSVRGPKVTAYKDVHGPGVDQIQRMLTSTNASTPLIAARDRAIIRLGFSCGLRRKEIAEPLVGHYLRDRHPAELSILGKRRDDRELVTLPSATSSALDEYLTLRGWPDPTAPLIARHDFAGDGRPMSKRSIYQRVRLLAERAGVAKQNGAHVGVHKLRRAAITTGLDKTDGDLRAMQAYSRHERSDMVLRYDDHRVDAAGRIAQLLDDLLDGDE